MKALSTAAVLVTALGLGSWACTNTIVHEAAPVPDSGTVATDDAGTVMDDSATPELPDTSPTACPYPSGPYGKTQGMVLSPTATWQGYLKGSNTVGTLKATDLFDCDGSKGINAIVMDESAGWCGACQEEATDLPKYMPTWGPQGVMFVTLMVQDQTQQLPGTTNTALEWRDQFSLGSIVNVMADPQWTFSHAGSIGLPQNILIDPRTMRILSTTPEGYCQCQDPAVSQLAIKNGAH